MSKLLAAVGLGAALLLGVATDASANPWRGHGRPGPVYRPGPVVVAPVYRAPVYRAPVYQAPVYVAPPRVVYTTPVYGPVYRPVHHHHWVRPHGHRW